ncbi:hypothetical protein LZ30DRAFT_714679 [Colletotrichum cereale]|nr:hypothetical protein LZ30DRAFT_714679 [Colletotrichum cereale]
MRKVSSLVALFFIIPNLYVSFPFGTFACSRVSRGPDWSVAVWGRSSFYIFMGTLRGWNGWDGLAWFATTAEGSGSRGPRSRWGVVARRGRDWSVPGCRMWHGLVPSRKGRAKGKERVFLSRPLVSTRSRLRVVLFLGV